MAPLMSETRVRVISKTDERHRLADKIRRHESLWFGKEVKIVAHRRSTSTCTGSSLCISYEAVTVSAAALRK